MYASSAFGRQSDRRGADRGGARFGAALRTLALALVVAGLAASLPGELTARPAPGPLRATSRDGLSIVEAVAGARRLRVSVADGPSREVALPPGFRAEAVFVADGGRYAFATAREGEAAVVVADAVSGRTRVVRQGALFSLTERWFGGGAWHRPAGSLVAPHAPLLLLDTEAGVKAVPAAAGGHPRTATAADLRPCLAALSPESRVRLTAVRGLYAAGEEAAIAPELDRLLRALRDAPHARRSYSKDAFRTLRVCFADDERLERVETILRLLRVYESWDRTAVRKLLADGPGRLSIRPLRRIVADDAAPMDLRVAAASCLMKVSSFRRTEAFLFALSQLGHENAAARKESYAVLTWFAGLMLLRHRSRVVAAVMGALSRGGGREDQAERLVGDGLRRSRSRGTVESIVLEHLQKGELPETARTSVFRALSRRLAPPSEPRELGDVILHALEGGSAELRRAALGAMAELRRSLSRADRATAFASPAEAAGWWRSARTRLD